ncbi:MAG: hypothetical protein LBV26_05215 [Bacteroidales bacterium]|nr:hypothetical protein [Bacteroidales bacterium]
MKDGFWSSFHNPALLALSKSFVLGVNYNNRFNINELSTRTAAVKIPAGKAVLGVLYSSFGYADFRRNVAGLSCGLNLSEKLSAGVQVDYFSELVPGEYEDRHFIAGGAGLVYGITKNTSIGVHVLNPVPNTLRKNDMPMTLRVGAGTKLNKSLFAGAEAEMSSGNRMALKMGLEYEIMRSFMLRSGFNTEFNSFGFGCGYMLRFMQLDLAFATHEKLGLTSSVSLLFTIR